MIDEPVFELEIHSLDPAILYLEILQFCPRDWTPADVQDMFLCIMAEYEEAPAATLTAIPGGKDTH